MRRGRLRKLQAGVLLPWTRPPYGYRLGLDWGSTGARPATRSGSRLGRAPVEPAGSSPLGRARWVEPAEAASVREIFARSLETTGRLAGLANYLSAQGIATPRGKAFWSASSVHGILTNPTYTGQIYTGQIYTGQIYAGRTRTRGARGRGQRVCATRRYTPSDLTRRALLR